MNSFDTQLHIASDLSLPVEAVTQTFGILAKRGVGKALALDTPLPTPSGWTTMGEVKEGDCLFDENGEVCRVTAVHPIYRDHTCYRVRFSDGAEIVADAEHLWLTEDLLSRLADQNAKRYENRGRGSRKQCIRWRSPKLRTTEEIAATLQHGSRGDFNHAIATTRPLKLPEVKLPIDPYVLGVWLRDGTNAAAVITTTDQGVLEEIASRGYRVGAGYVSGNRTLQYRIHENTDGTSLTTSLKNLNLLHNKHVPQEYLRASYEQRLSLLRGLMDTDGGAERGRAVFCNTNLGLVDAVHELVVSLGWKVYRWQKVGRLNGVDHKIAYALSFRPDVQPFTLPRKFLPLGTSQATRHKRRTIVAVEQIESVPVRCIAVDSPSNLFLAGRDLIPTHNTYTALVMMEEMVKAGLHVVIVDPVGVCWGLRAAADGEHPGLPIVVMGGDHGDVPLEASVGDIIADFVIDEKQSVVLDLSHFRKAEQTRFVTDFAERLYQRNRDPLHLLLDEADAFAPQRPMKGQERMLGAIEDIVRRGRARGLGVSLVTQRAAVLNKDVLTQVEVLVALRTIAPQDREAIDAWIKVHGTPEQRMLLMNSLPSLPIGTAWFWSPGWLDLFQQVHVRSRETFDSSATPKVGEQRISPKQLAPVDLTRLRERIAATIEQAKASDPKFLHARIRELERQLKQSESRGGQVREVVKTVIERVEVPVFQHAEIERLEQALALLRETGGAVVAASQNIQTALSRAVPVSQQNHDAPPPLPLSPDRAPSVHPVKEERKSADGGLESQSLRAGERKMLEVLARHFPMKVTRAQLGTLANYAASGGTFGTYLGTLKRHGFISEPTKGEVTITQAGLAYLGISAPPPPQSSEAFIAMWLEALRLGERKMLTALISAYPDPLTRDELGRQVEMTPSGGTFGTYLGTLRRNGLIEVEGESVRASSILFDLERK